MPEPPTPLTAICAVCEQEFEAKTRRAKYCSPTCRSRAHRRKPASSSRPPVRPPSSDRHPLVVQLRAELEAAGRLESTSGQLALALARQVTAAGATGIAGLSKELRTVREDALRGAVVPGAPAADEDEVERARRRREEKRAAAGRA